MTVSHEMEARIRRLHFAEHWPVGTIARQLAVHEEVVRRILGLLNRKTSAVPRDAIVAPYSEFILETLISYPGLRATRVYDMVKARGYMGSVRTIRQHVQKVRPVPKREAFLRIDALKGQQAQIDWAYVGKIPVLSEHRALWLFVMLMPYSRGMWAEFVFDLSVHSLLRSLARAGEYFGGNCRQWLFDNAKTVVVDRSGDTIRFHHRLVELASTYHVQLRVCAVRKPNQKGGVERSIRYLRDRFLSARTISSIEQGNQDLLKFFDEVAHARSHPTQQGKTVIDCLEEERRVLLPLPDPRPITDLVSPIIVDKTASIRFDTNTYSVPAKYVGKTLTLVADDRMIQVIDGDIGVAQHQRSWGKRQRIENVAHRSEILQQKKIARTAQGRDRLRNAVPTIDTLFASWVTAGRSVRSMTNRTLRLLDLYGETMLQDAVREALLRGVSDVGALAQLCEEYRHKSRLPIPVEMSLGDHVPDCDVIPHALEKYDDHE